MACTAWHTQPFSKQQAVVMPQYTFGNTIVLVVLCFVRLVQTDNTKHSGAGFGTNSIHHGRSTATAAGEIVVSVNSWNQKVEHPAVQSTTA
jgi:hypothetical protein